VKPIQQQISPQNYSHAPNKLNTNQFNPQSHPNENQSSISSYQMSKDGVENLKSKFYESASKSTTTTPLYKQPTFYSTNNSNEYSNNYTTSLNFNDNKPQQAGSQISKVRLNKLSSHENYLFNNKNNPNNQSQSNSNYDEYNSRSNYDDSIATSDL
jgi:hypothetical protein